jgi:hypothetical protein
MTAPIQFYQYAKREIVDYLNENDEWRNNTDLEEFKEVMTETLFNSFVMFHTATECIDFIDNKARLIFDLIDYVLSEGEASGDLVSQFNLCQYYVGRTLIDEIEDMEKTIQDWSE